MACAGLEGALVRAAGTRLEWSEVGWGIAVATAVGLASTRPRLQWLAALWAGWIGARLVAGSLVPLEGGLWALVFVVGLMLYGLCRPLLFRAALPGVRWSLVCVSAAAIAGLLGTAGANGSAPPVLGWVALAASAAVALGYAAAPLLLVAGLGAADPPEALAPWDTQEARSSAAADPALPHVLLVSVDTLRLDAARGMESYRRLVAEGVELEMQAASPWTLPSVASLMTGVAPGRHGATRTDAGSFRAIDSGVPTLAERLAAHGYHTVASVENPFVGPQFGFDRGFAEFHVLDPGLWKLGRDPFGTRVRLSGPALLEGLGLLQPLPDQVWWHLERARERIAARPPGAPLFVWVHLFEPHAPYWNALSADASLGERVRWARVVRSAEEMSFRPEEIEGFRRAYDHEVDLLDEALGALLQVLPEDRPTVEILTSDHGEEFLEHGSYDHGHTMYQELLSVPMAIRGIPGLASGGLASHLDLAPTLLAGLGLPTDGLEGHDLRRRPRASARSSGTLYGDPTLRSIRRGDGAKVIAGEAVSERYDLASDPAEQSPLEVDGHWLKLLDPPAASREGPAVDDPELRAKLRALGYVE